MNHQERVAVWLDQVFDAEERANTKERSLRVVEEAIELAQACGADEATVHRLVEYIFERPVGEPAKELAGVMVTVYAAAEALGESADARFDEEMHRIWRPEVRDRVRRRQVEKRARLLAYDGPPPPPPPPQIAVYVDRSNQVDEARLALGTIDEIRRKTRCQSVSPKSATHCELDAGHHGAHIGYGPKGMSDERVWHEFPIGPSMIPLRDEDLR